MNVIITHGLVPSVWALFGLALVAGGAGVCDAFQVGPSASSRRQTQPAGIVGIPLGLAVTAKTTVLFLAAEGGDGDKKKEKDDDVVVDVDVVEFQSEEDKEKAVGNLVQEDEWNGLGIELAETIRRAVVEDMKEKTRDFIGKDDYEVRTPGPHPQID